MSTFDNKSLKKVTLKSTTTHQCSTSKNDKSNCYLTSPSIHNYTTSDNFSNTKYEVDVPLIYNEWEDYARKDEESYLNSNHNMSTKHTIKRQVHKLNEFFRRSHLNNILY